MKSESAKRVKWQEKREQEMEQLQGELFDEAED